MLESLPSTPAPGRALRGPRTRRALRAPARRLARLIVAVLVVAIGAAPLGGMGVLRFTHSTAQAASMISPSQAADPNVDPPPAPQLLSPAPEDIATGLTHPPIGLPTLRWQPLANAAIYEVQISNDPGLSTVLTVQTYSDRYSPGVQAFADPLKWGDGAYYWRVRAGAKSGYTVTWGPFSPVQRFYRNWDAGGQLKPTLLLPEQNAVRAAFRTGDFSWTPVLGAARYTLEISADSNFASLTYSAVTLQPAHTPRDRLPSNTYYWRVIPEDVYGNHSTASATQSFVFDWNAPPQLLAPDDNLDTPFAPRFSWVAVEAAAYYILQISTSDTFDPVAVTEYRTFNTDFTPLRALANDQDYFWRVRAVSNARENMTPFGIKEVGTGWSPKRHFRIKWNFAPKLLTPGNVAVVSYPVFGWEPVPGVEQYQVQIDEGNNLVPPLIGDNKIYNAPGWAQPKYQNGLLSQYYVWRVRGLDAQGNATPWSDTRTFAAALTTAAVPVYPPYYYPPDSANLPVRKDVSIAWPVFVWDTAHIVTGYPVNDMGLTVPPHHYRLLVDDNDDFSSPNLEVRTAGLAAAITPAATHSPLMPGTIYFWRVQAFEDAAEAQEVGVPAIWQFRYDPAQPELPFAAAPTLIQPADRFEAVGDPPVLGWLPFAQGARTRVQVSRDPSFVAIVDDAIVTGAHYVPWQGRTERMPFGAYWWRIQQVDGSGNPAGPFSEARRFNLSVDIPTLNPIDYTPGAASSLLATTATYTPAPSFVDASPASNSPLDLGALHVATDRVYTGSQNWVLAFQAAPALTATVFYTFFVDIDHVAEQGAAVYPVTGAALPVDTTFRPEYMVAVKRVADSVAATDVRIYEWNATAQPPRWNATLRLADILGQAWFDAATQTVQLVIPYTALGAGRTDFSGSLALFLISGGSAGMGGAGDVVPPQPAAPYARPAFVSDALTPLYPFDTPFSNPRILNDMPTLRWRVPYFDSIDGYQVQVARDSRFTDIVETWETFESKISAFFQLLPAAMQSNEPWSDNETYYWRVRIRHERFDATHTDFFDYGPWSASMRFKLDSRRVGNPRLSTDVAAYMTPTFLWDRVEGAAGYVFQLDNDAEFNQPLLEIATDATSYTPTEAQGGQLKPGTQYFWRVAIRRANNVLGQWTAPLAFTKSSVLPALAGPANQGTVIGQPTFAWAPILTPSATPRLAAPRYRLLVDDDPGFGSPALNELTQATFYTPPAGKALDQGTWHWKVALVDAAGAEGPFSPTWALTRTYGLAQPVVAALTAGAAEPATAASVDAAAASLAPMLAWTPVAGAAIYKVEFSQSESFSNSSVVRTSNTAYTPTAALKPGVYFWRVQMIDADENPGPRVGGQFLYGTMVFLPTINK